MYRGYSLEISLESNDYLKHIGKSQFEAMKSTVAKTLQEFISCDGVVDATKLQGNWFPTVKADIFISHSHKDFDNVCILAGWLKEKFDLTVFIDSCIWGNYTDILRQIDKKYCYSDSLKIYDYGTRNITTSHVHMMLANALSMMIYNTECLFFINTPNSISFKSTVVDKTLSPWIYHEMIASKYLRPSELIRPKSISENLQFSSGEIMAMDSMPKFEYDLPKDHLVKLSFDNLNELVKSCISMRYDKYKFLDLLYSKHKMKD